MTWCGRAIEYALIASRLITVYTLFPPGSHGTYYWVWSLISRLNELTVISRGCLENCVIMCKSMIFFPTLLMFLLAPSSPSFPFSISLLLPLVFNPSLSIAVFPTYCPFLFLCFCFLLSFSAPTLTSSFPFLLCDRLFLGKWEQMLAHSR